MLCGGIIGAIQSTTPAAIAGNIIKAFFFEFGLLAGYLLGVALVSLGVVIGDETDMKSVLSKRRL